MDKKEQILHYHPVLGVLPILSKRLSIVFQPFRWGLHLIVYCGVTVAVIAALSLRLYTSAFL